jgi:transposase
VARRNPGHYNILPGKLSIPARAYEAEKLKREGLTAKVLAERFDVSEATIWQWLKHVREERASQSA